MTQAIASRIVEVHSNRNQLSSRSRHGVIGGRGFVTLGNSSHSLI